MGGSDLRAVRGHFLRSVFRLRNFGTMVQSFGITSRWFRVHGLGFELLELRYKVLKLPLGVLENRSPPLKGPFLGFMVSASKFRN